MSDHGPATREDFRELLAAEFRAGFASLADVLRPAANVQNLNVQPAPQPRAERLVPVMWVIVTVMAFFGGCATVAAVLQGQRISDVVVLQASLRNETKAEVLAERESRERFEAWVAQEANTMRTFAKTGVLAPMQPRPTPAAQQDHKP